MAEIKIESFINNNLNIIISIIRKYYNSAVLEVNATIINKRNVGGLLDSNNYNLLRLEDVYNNGINELSNKKNTIEERLKINNFSLEEMSKNVTDFNRISLNILNSITSEYLKIIGRISALNSLTNNKETVWHTEVKNKINIINDRINKEKEKRNITKQLIQKNNQIKTEIFNILNKLKMKIESNELTEEIIKQSFIGLENQKQQLIPNVQILNKSNLIGTDIFNDLNTDNSQKNRPLGDTAIEILKNTLNSSTFKSDDIFSIDEFNRILNNLTEIGLFKSKNVAANTKVTESINRDTSNSFDLLSNSTISNPSPGTDDNKPTTYTNVREIVSVPSKLKTANIKTNSSYYAPNINDAIKSTLIKILEKIQETKNCKKDICELELLSDYEEKKLIFEPTNDDIINLKPIIIRDINKILREPICLNSNYIQYLIISLNQYNGYLFPQKIISNQIKSTSL